MVELTHHDPEHEHLWSQTKAKPSINPLMFPDEIERLTKVFQALEDDAHIVEYGCGGSTLLWASLLLDNQHLYSIEHNETWYRQISEAVQNRPNITLMYAPIPEMTSYASATEELPIGADAYINPDSIEWRDVRMVFIDGVARGACLAACRHRCQPECHIFLHDYVGRETWYNWAVHLFRGGRVTHTLLEVDITSWDTE